MAFPSGYFSTRQVFQKSFFRPPNFRELKCVLTNFGSFPSSLLGPLSRQVSSWLVLIPPRKENRRWSSPHPRPSSLLFYVRDSHDFIHPFSFLSPTDVLQSPPSCPYSPDLACDLFRSVVKPPLLHRRSPWGPYFPRTP